MRIAIGASPSSSVEEATAGAVGSAQRGCPDPGFAIVLSTDQYDADALACSMTRALGGVPWAGCCTAGVFAGAELYTQGLVVGLLPAPAARVAVGVAGPVSADGRAAGARAAADALACLPPVASLGWSRALIVLPDALTGNAADVVRGALQAGGTGVAWAGGGAGDNLRFVRTAQFAAGRAHTDSVVVIAIDAPAPMVAGIRHGFRPYGAPAMVTRAAGSVLAELDYEPAFSAYQRAADRRGDRVGVEGFASFAMTHPLGIPQGDGEHVIRDPLHVDAEGRLHCVGEVPDGCLVRVMEGDREGILGAARDAARAGRQLAGGPIGGAIVFDCVSRSVMLGEGMRDELELITGELGAGVAVMGCLTFGEVGVLGRGVPQFHNKTAVVLALGAARDGAMGAGP